MYRHLRPDLVIELPYGAIETVDIGGPGLVLSYRLSGLAFGTVIALEGLTTAAVLRSPTARTEIKTVISTCPGR